jgi:hypothetical protein
VAVTEDWEERTAAAWATFDDYEEADAADFRAVIDAPPKNSSVEREPTASRPGAETGTLVSP